MWNLVGCYRSYFVSSMSIAGCRLGWQSMDKLHSCGTYWKSTCPEMDTFGYSWKEGGRNYKSIKKGYMWLKKRNVLGDTEENVEGAAIMQVILQGVPMSEAHHGRQQNCRSSPLPLRLLKWIKISTVNFNISKRARKSHWLWIHIHEVHFQVNFDKW